MVLFYKLQVATEQTSGQDIPIADTRTQHTCIIYQNRYMWYILGLG